MENASKALIIAGAILIAILLISVGIMIMNSVNNPAGEVKSQSDAMTVQMFNEQFTPYIGIVSRSEANQLISKVIASNKTNEQKVTVTASITQPNSVGYSQNYTLSNDKLDEIQRFISMSKKISAVSLSYENGYVSGISIALAVPSTNGLYDYLRLVAILLIFHKNNVLDKKGEKINGKCIRCLNNGRNYFNSNNNIIIRCVFIY